MINQPQPNVAQPSIPIPVQPARILLGWMSEQDGALWLAGRRTDLQNNPEYIERSRLARNAVASRKAGLDQGEVIHKPSEALAPYIASFSQDPVGQHFINEGWRVVIADLTKVCAVQPHVLTDSARQRVPPSQASTSCHSRNSACRWLRQIQFPCNSTHRRTFLSFHRATPTFG